MGVETLSGAKLDIQETGRPANGSSDQISYNSPEPLSMTGLSGVVDQSIRIEPFKLRLPLSRIQEELQLSPEQEAVFEASFGESGLAWKLREFSQAREAMDQETDYIGEELSLRVKGVVDNVLELWRKGGDVVSTLYSQGEEDGPSIVELIERSRYELLNFDRLDRFCKEAGIPKDKVIEILGDDLGMSLPVVVLSKDQQIAVAQSVWQESGPDSRLARFLPSSEYLFEWLEEVVLPTNRKTPSYAFRYSSLSRGWLSTTEASSFLGLDRSVVGKLVKEMLASVNGRYKGKLFQTADGRGKVVIHPFLGIDAIRDYHSSQSYAPPEGMVTISQAAALLSERLGRKITRQQIAAYINTAGNESDLAASVREDDYRGQKIRVLGEVGLALLEAKCERVKKKKRGKTSLLTFDAYKYGLQKEEVEAIKAETKEAFAWYYRSVIDSEENDAILGVDTVIDTETLYSLEVNKYPLLDRHEEQELFQIFDKGRKALSKLQSQASRSMSVQEKQGIVREVLLGQKAERILIQANLRLVRSIARKYYLMYGEDVPFVDLVQEGNIILLRSVVRFNHRKGNKFSTYAYNCIEKKMGRVYSRKGLKQPLPDHTYALTRRYVLVCRRLRRKLGRELTEDDDSEIVRAMGRIKGREARMEDLTDLRQAIGYRDAKSLDAPAISSSEDSSSLAELLSSEGRKAFSRVAARQLRNIMLGRIKILPDQQKRVILGKYYEGLSISEIAAQLRVSDYWCRKLHNRAVAALTSDSSIQKFVDVSG